MEIKTKYEVGHKFWVPRSFSTRDIEKLHFEGETWEREIMVYKAIVKKKEIIGIAVHVNIRGELKISYSVVNEGDYATLSQHYQEENISSYTEEEAWVIANKFSSEKKEYFGN